MIEPNDMTLLQHMYALCNLGVALSAKQKNKDTISIFAKYGSIMTGAVIAEAEHTKIDENEIVEFLQLMPFVADKLVGSTEEDREFIKEVAKEKISELIDVNDFFSKDSKHEFVMSEEEFNKFMSDYKKEDDINAS